MRLLQKECGKCLRHPFLWIVCITFGLFQFLSIYTYVGNAGMRKELRQMHMAVTDEETASPEYESAYADYKKTYGGMYDTLDMRKILEEQEKKKKRTKSWGYDCAQYAACAKAGGTDCKLLTTAYAIIRK